MRLPAIAVSLLMTGAVAAQSPGIPSLPADLLAGRSPLPNSVPIAEEAPCPINLATALALANARPLDIALAAARVDGAIQREKQARLLWVPNLTVGGDYFNHQGAQQNFLGEVVNSNRWTYMAGLGPNIVFAPGDAFYAPLAARQDLLASRAFLQATSQDIVLKVAEAYFDVQQARAELAGALFAEQTATEVARKTEKLAEGLVPPLEASRARVELARRRQAVIRAREYWRVASAELSRLLRLPPSVLVEPVEPPTLPIPLIGDDATPDSLIPIALTHRPELAGYQALVQATMARLKQEQLRPLVPSLAIRSVSTTPAGSLGYGAFGDARRQEHRFDIDVQLLWEFSALGFGNRARANERKAEQQYATLDLFRTQDRIAAEVATAHAQLRSAAERLALAGPALADAVDLTTKSVEGMGQTRRIGEVIAMVVRPQEVVAALQSFAQANSDFAAAAGEYNRSQFRLYRALGHPAGQLSGAAANLTGYSPTELMKP